MPVVVMMVVQVHLPTTVKQREHVVRRDPRLVFTIEFDEIASIIGAQH